MSNPNTVTVFSPEGEPFEMSRVNARDLCNHREWSMSPPEGGVTAPVEEPADAVDEAGETETTEEAGEEEVTDEVTVFTTEEQFAALTEREDVVAYLAATFPEFKPHHKSSRDGLVAKAIELAAG